MRVSDTGYPITTIAQVLKHQAVCPAAAAALVAMHVGRPQRVSVLVPMHGPETALLHMADGQGNAVPFRPQQEFRDGALVDADGLSGLVRWRADHRRLWLRSR